jgi:hypothetical protein
MCVPDVSDEDRACKNLTSLHFMAFFFPVSTLLETGLLQLPLICVSLAGTSTFADVFLGMVS